MGEKNMIGKVANTTLKSNQLRNIFVIVGIVLTTVLFTCIFTIGSSWILSINESQKRQIGISAHGEFKYLSYEEYEIIEQHDSIKNIGSSRIIAPVENPEINNRKAELRTISNEWVSEALYSKPTVGKLPVNEDEVAMDTTMLALLGIPGQLGEKVNITYHLDGKERTDTFCLSGYWEGDTVAPSSLVFVSKEYSDKLLNDYQANYDGDFTGTWNAIVEFKNTKGIDEQFVRVIKDSGYEPEQIRYAASPVYSFNIKKIDKTVLLIVCLVIVIIVICGYLIISNVFSISIINDIHHYALYKLIGVTQKQMSSIVKCQVLKLCIVGIPLGSIGGYVVGYLITPYTFQLINASVKKISINPLIFVMTAIFSLITVFVGTFKSVKIVQQVSPIAALRSTEMNLNSKEKTQKTIFHSGKMKLAKMACVNVFQNRKKSYNVILSLIVSMILLNISYSLANNFDLNKYISTYINCDFMVADTDYFNPTKKYEERGVLGPKQIESLKQTEGICQCGSVYFSEINYQDKALLSKYQELLANVGLSSQEKQIISDNMSRESLFSHLYGIDASLYEELEIYAGTFDRELFDTGDYILVSSLNNHPDIFTYREGDTVRIADYNGSVKEYTVMAVACLPYRLSVRHSHIVTPDFILPSSEYCELHKNNNAMLFTLNVTDDKKASAKLALAEYCKKMSTIQYVSKEDYIDDFRDVKRTFMIVGITLSSVLGLIGILNFLNSVITSIITRRREFALIQSIGMTSKQLTEMIVCEGLIYMISSYMVVLTIGYLIGKMVLCGLASQIGYLADDFSLVASLICLPIMLLISMSIPYISIRYATKKSIIERLVRYVQ